MNSDKQRLMIGTKVNQQEIAAKQLEQKVSHFTNTHTHISIRRFFATAILMHWLTDADPHDARGARRRNGQHARARRRPRGFVSPNCRCFSSINVVLHFIGGRSRSTIVEHTAELSSPTLGCHGPSEQLMKKIMFWAVAMYIKVKLQISQRHATLNKPCKFAAEFYR